MEKNDIFNKSKKSHICGDFNINLLQIQTNDRYSQIYENMMSVGFIPNMHIPIKRRKFNKRKDKKEVWMTDQLLALVNRKKYWYIELKKTPKLSNCYNTKKVNFKTYEGIVNRETADAKTQYYASVFQSNKSNMKKSWQVINDTLSRNKTGKSLPDFITIDGEKITEHKEISNIFNKYFANIGTNWLQV